MKKNLKIMLLVLAVGLLTTGCMEEKISIAINNDKSMNFNMYMSLDLKAMQELADSFGGTNEEMTDEEYLNCVDENDGDATNCIEPGSSSSSSFDIDDIKDSIEEGTLKELEEKGYTVTQNVTSNKMEVNISKTYSNIEDVSSNEDVNFNFEDGNEKFFKIEKGFLEDKYTFHMVNNSQDNSIDNSGLNFDTESIDPSILTSMIDISVEMTLPKESISNNATSVSNDKKTLTWNLVANENKDILVTFALPNSNKNLIIYGGIGIAVLLILIILIVFISKSKKKKSKDGLNQGSNISQESISQNIASNQPVVNQNINEQTIGQTMNNGPISMPINGEELTPVSPILQSVEPTPVVNQTPIVSEAPAVEQSVEPAPVVNQTPIVAEAPAVEQSVEPAPVVDQTPIVPEAPAVEQSIEHGLTSTSQPVTENDVNKINSDLQNMALNLLNHNNDND